MKRETPPPATLEDLVARGVEQQFDTLQAIADAMEMSLSAFSRGVKLRQLSVDSCLRLAEVLGEPPSFILDLAGKAETARRIERLYGGQQHPLSTDDRFFVALPSPAKRQLRRVVETIEGLKK